MMVKAFFQPAANAPEEFNRKHLPLALGKVCVPQQPPHTHSSIPAEAAWCWAARWPMSIQGS